MPYTKFNLDAATEEKERIFWTFFKGRFFVCSGGDDDDYTEEGGGTFTIMATESIDEIPLMTVAIERVYNP